jgi:hypothetical protein
MAKSNTYGGIDKDINGGMTAAGKIIRDAWVFGLIPESETCEGWDNTRLEALMHQVDTEWDKYGCMVSTLPEELREKHQRIHGEWLTKAKQAGWSGEVETDDD